MTCDCDLRYSYDCDLRYCYDYDLQYILTSCFCYGYGVASLNSPPQGSWVSPDCPAGAPLGPADLRDADEAVSPQNSMRAASTCIVTTCALQAIFFSSRHLRSCFKPPRASHGWRRCCCQTGWCARSLLGPSISPSRASCWTTWPCHLW